MQALEAVYDGRAFVPVKPVHLKKDQKVFFTYSREVTPEESTGPAVNAVNIVEFLQSSPLHDGKIVLERYTTAALRGTEDELFD